MSFPLPCAQIRENAVKDRDFLRCRQIGVPQAPFDYFGVKAAHAVCQGLRVLPGRCMQDDLPDGIFTHRLPPEQTRTAVVTTAYDRTRGDSIERTPDTLWRVWGQGR